MRVTRLFTELPGLESHSPMGRLKHSEQPAPHGSPKGLLLLQLLAQAAQIPGFILRQGNSRGLTLLRKDRGSAALPGVRAVFQPSSSPDQTVVCARLFFTFAHLLHQAHL